MPDLPLPDWLDHSSTTGLLVVVSGPSGVGKDSVIARARELGCRLHFVPTVTARAPRPDEVDGQDYHFVSPARFQEMIEAGGFLEWALVYGDYKGNRRADVRAALDAGHNVVLRVDTHGARTIRRLVPEAILVFISPPSLEVLKERLRQRKTESEEDLAHRLRIAREEMLTLPEFDYVVVNRQGELDAAAARLKAIVEAEESRVHPRRVTL
jgi:guanylate kinase